MFLEEKECHAPTNHLGQGASYGANAIKAQKLFRAPACFEFRPDKKYGQPIEEQMRDSTMQKWISQNLPKLPSHKGGGRKTKEALDIDVGELA